MSENRIVTLRLGGDGLLRLDLPPKYAAHPDLERLLEVIVAAVKEAGGEATQVTQHETAVQL